MLVRADAHYNAMHSVIRINKVDEHVECILTRVSLDQSPYYCRYTEALA